MLPARTHSWLVPHLPDPARRRRTALGLALLVIGGVGLAACRSGITKGELYLQYGFERLALGDTTEALEYMQRARFEMHDDPRVLFHIARLRAADGSIRGRNRARALLEEAVRERPENGLYRAELGILLRRQRYVRASTKQLSEAVLLDSTLSRAWATLGLNIQERYFDRLDGEALRDSAIACYERALRLDEHDRDTRYRLAFLYMHRGQYAAARALAAPYAYGRECPARFGLLLVALHFRTGQFDAAQHMLDQLLGCMPWEERESWVGLKPLMHPDSASTYTILDDSGRDSTCTEFWWARDPTPTTLANERLIEHITRAVEADTYFEVALLGRAGRTTDRGEIYMRYGPPSELKRTFEGRGWEWRYPSPDPDEPTEFFFFDEYHNGDYLRLRPGTDADFARPSALETVPEVTRLEFKTRESSWRYTVRQFRGARGRTAVEIAFVVTPTPFLESIQTDVAAWRGPRDIAAQRASVATSDAMFLLGDGSQIGRMRVELAPGAYVLGMQAMAIRHEGVIPPPGPDGSIDHDRVAWVAFERDTVQLRRFDPETLAMSDIVLAHELRDAVGGLFDMGGVRVVPRVHPRVARNPLDLYFEVYPPERALRERTGLAVTYEVRPLPPATWSFWDQFRAGFRRRMNPGERPVVQATFTFLPTEAVERQQLSIDMSALEPGPYALTIELVDTATGDTTESTVAFEYVPPRPDDS